MVDKHKQALFLEALKTHHGNVSQAARSVGLSYQKFVAQAAWSKPFRTAWDNTIREVIDSLEELAFIKAQGQLTKIAGNYPPSDQLIIKLLEAHRPEKYRDMKNYQVPTEPISQSININFIDRTKDEPQKL